MEINKFNSFKEFYPFYLSEHKKSLTKKFQMIGSLGVLAIVFYSFYTKHWQNLYFTPICGYGFAWISHFFIEKNRSATFKYPLYSFIGDWVMLKDILTDKVKL